MSTESLKKACFLILILRTSCRLNNMKNKNSISKNSHSECCRRDRIFPFRKARYSVDGGEWIEESIMPDHIDGAYNSPKECISQMQENEYRDKRKKQIWNYILKHYGLNEE